MAAPPLARPLPNPASYAGYLDVRIKAGVHLKAVFQLGIKLLLRWVLFGDF